MSESKLQPDERPQPEPAGMSDLYGEPRGWALAWDYEALQAAGKSPASDGRSEAASGAAHHERPDLFIDSVFHRWLVQHHRHDADALSL